MKRQTYLTAAATVALALTTSLLAACSEAEPEVTETTNTPESTAECTDDLLACAKDSSIADLVPDEATEATGEPIELGMVNQENTAAGSYPELSGAVAAGVEFVNTQLGGVNGRPISVEVCNTEFSTEGSTSCGQQFVESGAPAVLGGIDVFGNGIEVLDDNGVPFVGGIPVSDASGESPNSFQWSGGSWGSIIGFADFATTKLDVEKVSIVFGEFGSIAQAAEMGQQVLEARGVEVQMIPYPVVATDISAPLNAAATFDPDAVFLLAADSGCKAGFDGIASLGMDAHKFFSGACASPAIIEEAGPDKTEGTYFNVESPVNQDQPETDAALYQSIVDTYGNGMDAVGAGTVTFKAFMNLYRVLVELDGDITPEAIMSSLKAKVDAPGYWGHTYTCDGEQFDGLPALCSPEQIIVQQDDGQLVQVSDWIDVGQIYPA